jgi:hypothetical protein
MGYIKKFFALCVMITACGTVALAQSNGCSGKVSEDLANQLLRQAFKLMETPQDEQEKITSDAGKMKGGAASRFCAESVDLDRDGKLDLLIHQADVEGAFCGAHNCPVWAYRNTGNGYKMLMEDFGGYISPIEALRTSTGGYRDIRTMQHSSAVEHEITVFKFNGTKYVPRVCTTEKYVGKRRGKERFTSVTHKCGQ